MIVGFWVLSIKHFLRNCFLILIFVLMYWHYHLLLVDQMYNIAGKINFTKKGFTSLDDTADADKIVKGLISNKRDNGQLCFYPGFKLTYTLSSLRIYWRLLMMLKTSNKSVWSDDFWYLKVCIFWKCIRYTIHWDKTQMSKKFPSDKINGTKNALFFLLRPWLIAVLLLICDSYMSWSTMFVSLKLSVGFSIFNLVSFLSTFLFLFNKLHGLFDFKT